jgi:hypothetical protein
VRQERTRWIKASVGRQVRVIDVDEVLFFQSDTRYTRIVLRDYEALVRTPLKDLLSTLDSGPLLADPPRHRGERECDRRGGAPRRRTHAGAGEGERRKTGGEPDLRAPVSGNK